jgi:hypothetical protein
MHALNHHYTILNLNLTKNFHFADIKKIQKNTHNVWTLQECIDVVLAMFKADKQARVQIVVDKSIVLHQINNPDTEENQEMYICSCLINSLASIVHSVKG